MFNKSIRRFRQSEKSKSDTYAFLKDTNNDIMMLEGLREYLNKSIVQKIEVDKDGIYIVLNEHFYNIKFQINRDDIEQLPIDILCMGNYEPNEFAVVKALLDLFDSKGDFVFLDVGANLGWYSLFVNRMFQKGYVYSFEPATITYERLSRNIECNHVNVSTYNVGLYDTKCEKIFYYDNNGSGASSLGNIREKENITVEKVKLLPMDEWVHENKIDRVDFIKMDIEGSELFAIKGGEKTIGTYKPVIFCEMLRKWSARFGYHPNDIIQFLRSFGYGCYALGKYSPGIRICNRVDETTEETNFFFLHEMNHSKIIEELLNHEIWMHFY